MNNTWASSTNVILYIFVNTRFIICIIVIFILFLLIGFDPRLEVTNYTYKSAEIPSDFDGFKICQISDLHCKNFGKDNQTLIAAIQEMNPDIVVLTGHDAFYSSYKKDDINVL